MPDAEAERLIGYLVEKNRIHLTMLAGGSDSAENTLVGIVATTVADTLLVAEGTLSVDDYAPRETV